MKRIIIGILILALVAPLTAYATNPSGNTPLQAGQSGRTGSYICFEAGYRDAELSGESDADLQRQREMHEAYTNYRLVNRWNNALRTVIRNSDQVINDFLIREPEFITRVITIGNPFLDMLDGLDDHFPIPDMDDGRPREVPLEELERYWLDYLLASGRAMPNMDFAFDFDIMFGGDRTIVDGIRGGGIQGPGTWEDAFKLITWLAENQGILEEVRLTQITEHSEILTETNSQRNQRPLNQWLWRICSLDIESCCGGVAFPTGRGVEINPGQRRATFRFNTGGNFRIHAWHVHEVDLVDMISTTMRETWVLERPGMAPEIMWSRSARDVYWSENTGQRLKVLVPVNAFDQYISECMVGLTLMAGPNGLIAPQFDFWTQRVGELP